MIPFWGTLLAAQLGTDVDGILLRLKHDVERSQ